MKVEELDIARATLKELDADIGFVKGIKEIQIICPTCHTIHSNDFANRFGLFNDADACRNLVSQCQNAIKYIERDIDSYFCALRVHDEKISKIEKLLEDTRGEIKLRDMLRDESERILDDMLSEERSIIDIGISEWKMKEESANMDMRSYNNSSRKAEIISFYADRLQSFSDELGVKFSESVLKSVSPKINETGSYGPRAILAYHYAVLHTIRKFTTSCLCPIVIDTPLQQDQDEENSQSIIEFALKNRPEDMQLILGTVSLHGAAYNGHIINPDRKESLLGEENYDRVKLQIRPYINKMIGYEQGELF